MKHTTNTVKLPATAKRIRDSKDYANIDGSIYTPLSFGRQKGQIIRKIQRKLGCGYMYCGIYSLSQHRCVQRRIHRVIAQTFIPNPGNLPVVGHKNNIKTDNRVENLYWTTYSENSQKAVDDGLLVNDKGYEDSQSMPVIMFKTTTNETLAKFGSIREAHRITGISQTTIARQAKYHRPVRKPFYFRYQDDPCMQNANQLVGMYDCLTHQLLQIFYNISHASQESGICNKTIQYQCAQEVSSSQGKVYFNFLANKCEQTIESNERVE